MMEAGAVGLGTAFAAGMVSFASPCVLPLVPAYVSYLSIQPGATAAGAVAPTRIEMLEKSAYFVLGFSTVFIALGAGATAIGQLFLRYRHEAGMAGGVLIVFMGLLMLGLARGLPWFERDLRFYPALRPGPFASLVLGLAFGFGWTPCIGPVLGAILTVSAVQYSVGSGMALLGSYAVGLGVPFVLTALFTHRMTSVLRRLRRMGAVLQYVAGAVMVLVGIAMITGDLNRFSYWLLELVPFLGRIG